MWYDDFHVSGHRVIAIVNQKGGCGKTTTSVNLSAALAREGHRVALIDLDPQAHATLGLGVHPEDLQQNIYDALVSRDVTLTHLMLDTDIPRLYLVPASLILSGAQVELLSATDREFRLRNRLADLPESFEFVIIDCPPSLNILTINALTAATDVLIPIQSHFYSLEGMKELMGTIEIVREQWNPNIQLLGILPTMIDKRLTAGKEMLTAIRNYFGDRVFQTVIHMNSKLFEAPASGKPIFLYDPRSKAATEYEALGREVLQLISHTHGTRENHPVYI